MTIEKFFETQNALAAAKAIRENNEEKLRKHLFNLVNVYLGGATYTATSDLAALLGDNAADFIVLLQNTGFEPPVGFTLEGKTINSLVTEIRISLSETPNEPEEPPYNFTAGTSGTFIGFSSVELFGSYTGTSSPAILALYSDSSATESILILEGDQTETVSVSVEFVEYNTFVFETPIYDNANDRTEYVLNQSMNLTSGMHYTIGLVF